MYRLWNTLDLRKSSQSMNALLLITCTCFELSLSLQFPHGSYLIQLHPRETLFNYKGQNDLQLDFKPK